jgi:hypothetical protein
LLALTALEAELRSVDDGTVLLFSARAKTTALGVDPFAVCSCAAMATTELTAASADARTRKLCIMRADFLIMRGMDSLAYLSLRLVIETVQVGCFAGKRAKSHPPIVAAAWSQ